MLRATFILALLSGQAVAATSCLPQYEGKPLASNDGASLYRGNPANHLLMAPTRQARTMRESNVWLLDREPVTLVCQYEGSRSALAFALPAGTRSCVQNLAANTMVCQ